MLPSLYLKSASANPPLRIGLLLDSPELPKCFAEVVDQILRSSFVRLELLVFNAEELEQTAKQPAKRSLFRKAIDLLSDSRRRNTFLFSLYQRWDHRHIVPLEDPLASVDCYPRLKHVDSISVVPITKRFVHRFPAEAIQRIREKQLDVLIRFGFNILRGDILSAAKYGVWSYHHGDSEYYRGGPAYFWEVYEGNPISGATLQVLNEQLDAGKVLYKGRFATYPGISRERNCVQPYWGASTFVIQKLRELHQHGWDHVERSALPPTPYLGKKKIYTAPSNSEMVRWLGPIFIRKAWQRSIRRPVLKHWRLAMRSGSPLIGDSAAPPDLSNFSWIESPEGHAYADPFLINDGDTSWAFFEDFDYSLKRARISCAKVQDGGIANPIPALERPYHLSYPCIFHAGREMYMIPETGSNGTVELYRCVQFPDKWDLEKVLFRARAVDTSIWIDDSLYWFFVTLQDTRGRGSQLWLFYANSPTGEWTPHPDNPISTDVRNARGAGAIFRHDGSFYRPSQDCSRHYGYSFTLNNILVCNRHEYVEKPVVTINPDWARGLVGTHTYSRAGQTEIIDGCTSIPVRNGRKFK